MKKTLSLLLAVLCLAITATAQTQQGYVKTKGRMVNGKYYGGQRIPQATVQVKDQSAVLSKADGTFSFPTAKKSYSIKQVEKKGYVLLDQDVLYRQYTYSTNPLVLVMEDKAQMEADRRTIERQVRRVTDEELQHRGEELEALKEQKKITEERYHELLQKLNNDYDNNEQLIKDMVEQYNKIDFDQLDEFNRKVSDYIINGRLDEADSMLRTKGSFVERNRQLDKLHEANVKNRATLEEREAVEDHMRQDLAQDYYSKFLIFKMKHQNDSAAYYIEKRSLLDTLNYEWHSDAGKFVEYYLANYEQAMLHYGKMLTIALLDQTDSNRIAASYNSVGAIYDSQGDYLQAIENYNKALKIFYDIKGDKSKEVSILYNNLGSAYYSIGEIDEALKLILDAYNIDKELEYEADDLALRCNNIGILCMYKGNFKDALGWFEKALEIYNKEYKVENEKVADVYNNIGGVYNALGDYAKEVEYLNKALEIYIIIYGENHPDVATVYNNIACVYRDRNDLEMAHQYMQKALEIRIKIYGLKHPDVATLYCNFGGLLYLEGEFQKAIEYHKKSLDISRSLFGENHSTVATGYNELGMAYYGLGNFDTAIVYITKALDIRISIFGKEHPSIAQCYNNLGIVCKGKSDFERAKMYYNNALTLYKEKFGENHYLIGNCYNNIGQVVEKQGDLAGALVMYSKAREIWEGALGKDHPNTQAVSKHIQDISTILQEK